MEILEQLWQYTQWANDIVLMTLEKYGQQTPAASLRLMSHIANTQSIWLSRIHGKPAPTGIWDEHDLETCRRMNQETLQDLKTVIDGKAGGLATIIAYKNFSGTPHETSILSILLQVLNHGTYHRAQIAMDLRQSGLEPINTDYISWVWAAGRRMGA